MRQQWGCKPAPMGILAAVEEPQPPHPLLRTKEQLGHSWNPKQNEFVFLFPRAGHSPFTSLFAGGCWHWTLTPAHCVAGLAPSLCTRVHRGPESHFYKGDILLSHLLIFLICFFKQRFASGLLLAFAFWLLRFCQTKGWGSARCKHLCSLGEGALQ